MARITRLLRSRTWLLRIAVGAVLAVLVGAWAVGVTRSGDTAASKEDTSSPSPSDSPTDSDDDPYEIVETTDPGATSSAIPSDDASAEATPNAVVPVAGEPAGAPVAPSAAPTATPKPPVKSPRPSAEPTPTPTPSPTRPANGCTELTGIVDCLLDPITAQP